jgi:hypothetical protein
MKTNRGQTLVEFALCIPLLALLLFGIIQYGFIFYTYISLKNASAVGARYATLSNPKPTVPRFSRSRLTPPDGRGCLPTALRLPPLS